MKTNQLVEVRNGSSVTTSLQIAKVFGKNHFDVLRNIRELECSPKFIARNFAVYHYHSKLNENVTRKLPMYYITRDGFTFLAMGFTGKIAAQFKEDYINAFNEMEHKLRTGVVPVERFNHVATKAKEILAEKFKLEKENARLLQLVQNGAGIPERLAELLMRLADDMDNSQERFLRPKDFYYLTEPYYEAIITSFSAWLHYENTHGFAPDVRDAALVKRLEAARLLYYDRNKRVPAHISLRLGHTPPTL